MIADTARDLSIMSTDTMARLAVVFHCDDGAGGVVHTNALKQLVCSRCVKHCWS